MTAEEKQAIDEINKKLDAVIDYFHIGQTPMHTAESIDAMAR